MLIKTDKKIPKKRGRNFNPKVKIDALVPLCFIKGISGGTIKYLAKNYKIVTIEELLSKQIFKIKNRAMQMEISNVINKCKNLIVSKQTLHFSKVLSKFNIRIKNDEFDKILGIVLFIPMYKKEDKSLPEVIKAVLPELFYKSHFREKMRNAKVVKLTLKSNSKVA